MSKRYVDMEQLENIFNQYGVPYTNIFDDLRQVSAEDVAKEMSPHDLRRVLEGKEQVFATQMWTKDDIVAALRAIDVEDDNMSDELISEIAVMAKDSLEDCSDNWERLHSVISSVRSRR